jgi:RNA 3'-terminal phosphate cyclase-like protein
MGKAAYKRLKGSRYLRQRLVLATLAGTPLVVEEIRSEESSPGLRPYEVSLLRLLESISDDCLVEINETGLFSFHKNNFCDLSIFFCRFHHLVCIN